MVIEIISYLSRCFSLGIRLFANMMSGHSLLNILAGFVLKLSQKSLIFGFFPFLIVLSISFLELGIAFLQSYVFVVLLCIYLNDCLNDAHESH
jgi:ATP synthase subunit 6